MKIWDRTKHLLSEPIYRTKFGFFILLGIVVSLLAILASDPWKTFFEEFAIVFIAIAVIQFLWDFLGGEPLELKVEGVHREVEEVNQSLTQEIIRVHQSLVLLKDLDDGDIGLERIWPERETWQADDRDGLEVWRERVYSAKYVEILSNTLWNNWMKIESFREKLFDNLARDLSVRILIYDPDANVAKMRAMDEHDPSMEDRGGGRHFEMQSEINATLLRLAEGWKNLNQLGRKNLEVRLTYQTLHFSQMIRADERMLMTLYQSGKSGTPSPTMQFRGSGSTYFRKYMEQFETMWKRGKPVDDKRFNEILQKERPVG